MVLLHRRCRAHHVRGCGPGPVPGQAARAGAGVAFVQAIFLPHDENCFALYQARCTSGVTAAGPLARLRFDQVTTRSSATRQADSRPARGRATFVTSGRRHHLPDPAGPPAWHGSTQTGQPASPRASAAWLALHRRPVPIRLSRQLAPSTPGGVTEMNPISWDPERTPAGPAALSSPAETPRAPCWHSHRNCPRSGQPRPNTAGIKPAQIVRDMSARVPPDDPAA